MLTIATDGACPGNPGPGGWAWVTADGRSDSGGEPAPSTNNRMELMAVEQA
ncbi:MAG TPA: ribonuclease HI, partial [Microthrixaceae bacterium]|nr:ribonuclease HI [Microthrixaceae bacterium]